MNLKPFIRSSLFLKGIFVISLFILLLISSISYRHINALTKNSELLGHSYKIQFQLEQILSLLRDAETGQRGYIITQDTVLLSPYKTAKGNILKSFLKLDSLTIDDQQNNNLDTLHQLINFRLELMAYSLRIVSAKTINKTLLDKNLLHGKEVMEKIRFQISKMSKLEFYKLNDHQKTYQREATYSPMSTFRIMIFALLVLILSYIRMNKDLLKIKRTNDDITITNKSMKHAEVIGEFGISICNIDTKELQFSDNLFRLLGIEPQSVEPTVENFLKFVHPDDRPAVSSGIDKMLNENKANECSYRIIRNGEIRYMTSMGIIISEGNNTLHIEIVKDITDQQLNEISLEERNTELEQSIKELESFNRVASHDLQEPLRKIQIFISRVTAKDMVNMSDTGKEYLFKIEASANRMRKLIDDLLLFSSTNKSEKVFGKADLNLLLTNAKQELAQAIEEKNAVIRSTQLPVLKVISFQIQQLFVNLIGNALKYSKPGIPPVISIDCGKLAVDDSPAFIKDTHKAYYKISISDNGMGFEQQFSEKIFTLFNRLHLKADYPGSGIGLSICKKIVENHDGFIIAEGKPDIGATFIVFLPA